MPPKKDAKKGGGKGDPAAFDADQEIKRLNSIIASLQMQLLQRAQESLRAEREKRELQSRVADLRHDFKETAEDTYSITAEMTRQYKAMEERFMEDINRLEGEISTLRDELAEARAAYEELQAEKDAALRAKDEEIAALKEKASRMAEEFGDMLQVTLQKMADKIEISAAKWEGDSSVPVLHRMTEFDASKP